MQFNLLAAKNGLCEKNDVINCRDRAVNYISYFGLICSTTTDITHMINLKHTANLPSHGISIS